MRKRYFISSAITLGLLLLTSKFWFIDGKQFDFYIFFIVLVVSYLFAFKIIDYLADFKTIQHQSRIEIVFLALFFTILFIPMMHITQDKISSSENRTLAVWKPLITSKGEINYKFGKDFDNWFNDRFFLRKPIVKTYKNFKYRIAYQYYETAQGFLNKKNKWMDSDKSTNDVHYTQKDYDKAVRSIVKLQKFCEKNNIRFYIIIAPRKQEIYTKELYPMLKNKSRFNESIKMANYIKNKTNVDIIYPFNELKDLSKKDYAYFKSDHHWTDEGAYLGYLKLMQQVKKDYPDIYINTNKDFDYFYSNKVRVLPDTGLFEGRTYKVMNLHDKKLLDAKYKYYKHKKSDNIKYHSKNFKGKYYWFLDYKNNIKAPKLLLFGDSFTLNLLPSIVYSFSNTKNIYTYVSGENGMKNMNIKRFENEILNHKTDVLVICLSEIIRIGFLYEENE